MHCGTLVVLAGAVAIGCAPVGTFEMLVASEQELFTRCSASLGGDSRAAVYARLPSPRARRRWLAANGCPAETMNALVATPTLVVAVAAAAAPAPPAATSPAATSPAATSPAATSPAATSPSESSAPPPPRRTPPLTKPSPPEVASTPKPAPPPVVALPAVVAPPPSQPPALAAAPPPVRGFSGRDRGDARREQRLREIIVAHEAEMKVCVDRQLKLLPTLRAEGKLVIEVDASGAVPRAELQGGDLEGTPLESCLRALASRWRFPSDGRAYVIDAPLRVWGSE